MDTRVCVCLRETEADVGRERRSGEEEERVSERKRQTDRLFPVQVKPASSGNSVPYVGHEEAGCLSK